MTLRSLRAAWNSFFFEPRPVLPICFFRVVYGLLVTANLLLLKTEWLEWFGANAWLRLRTIEKLQQGPRVDVFRLLPETNGTAEAVFWVALLCAVALTCGLFTRLSAAAVWVCLDSLQDRNLLILHGGDVFLRVVGFFLIFAPAGAALSIDALLFRRLRRRMAAPWAQRMIQIQLSLLYLAGFLWKAQGITWVNGTAVAFVAQLHEMQRSPLPGWALNPAFVAFATWFTLALEFSLGVLVWIRELRYPILALGVLFHLTLEYWLNIPLFEWEILSAYVLFIDPRDFEGAITRLRRTLSAG